MVVLMVSLQWMGGRVELERVFSGIVRRRWPICRCAAGCLQFNIAYQRGGELLGAPTCGI
jgi:hypothetical protein